MANETGITGLCFKCNQRFALVQIRGIKRWVVPEHAIKGHAVCPGSGSFPKVHRAVMGGGPGHVHTKKRLANEQQRS